MKMMHVTIQTNCLEKSIKFYQEIVGLSIQQDMRNQGKMKIVFLGNAADETYVELIENMDETYSGNGISIGFHTENVEKAHKEMIAKGIEPTPVISPNPNVSFFFVKDPNGVSIQFI